MQFVKENSEVDKTRILPKAMVKKAATKWRRNENPGQQPGSRLPIIGERPEAELSSSSSNLSAGSLSSEESKHGACDPESSSSSDASDELDMAKDISEVSLQRLLQTSIHIFVEQHNPISFYETNQTENLRPTSMLDNFVGLNSDKENKTVKASHNIFDASKKVEATEVKRPQTSSQLTH